MRKIPLIYVLLTFALFGLTACGGSGGGDEQNTSPPTTDTTLDWDEDNWDEKDWT